jgi:hypothetical protein
MWLNELLQPQSPKEAAANIPHIPDEESDV